MVEARQIFPDPVAEQLGIQRCDVYAVPNSAGEITTLQVNKPDGEYVRWCEVKPLIYELDRILKEQGYNEPVTPEWLVEAGCARDYRDVGRHELFRGFFYSHDDCRAVRVVVMVDGRISVSARSHSSCDFLYVTESDSVTRGDVLDLLRIMNINVE